MTQIANHRVHRNTVKRKSTIGIIIGCQRVIGTWEHVALMCRNGLGAVRDGRSVRIIASEAFGTEMLQ